MKFRLFLLLGALSALTLGARAQVTYTNVNTGSPVTLDTTSATAIQTFTGFTSLSDVTWTLTNQGAGAPQTFNTYVALWNTDTNAVVGSLTLFGSANSSFTNVATGDLSFTDTWTAPDSSLTYALILTSSGGAEGTYTAAFGENPGDAFFGSGGAAVADTALGAGGSFANNLQNPANILFLDPGSAYTMSVTGIAATPVPEPKTVAAEIALLFVAVLVGRQIWLRRKPAAVMVPAV